MEMGSPEVQQNVNDEVKQVPSQLSYVSTLFPWNLFFTIHLLGSKNISACHGQAVVTPSEQANMRSTLRQSNKGKRGRPKKTDSDDDALAPPKKPKGKAKAKPKRKQRLPPKKNLPQRSQRLLQMWKPQMRQLPQMRKNRYLVVLAVGLPRKAVLLASVQASKAVEQGSKSQAIRSIKCWPLWQGKPCTCIMRTVP